jgi:hypothetical protein
VLDEVAKLVEDHVLVAIQQLFVLLFFSLENAFKEATSFLEKLLGILLVCLIAGDNSVLFVIKFLALLALHCVVDLELDDEVDALLPVTHVAPDPMVIQQSTQVHLALLLCVVYKRRAL